MTRIALEPARLAEFCQRRHIRRLSFFGSVLRDDFGPDSDVDVLMEFKPGHTPGLAIVDVEEALSQLLGGHKVDVVNPKYLNPRIKERVLAEAEVQYEEDSATYEDAMCELYLRMKMAKAKQAAEQGRVVAHAEVRRRFGR